MRNRHNGETKTLYIIQERLRLEEARNKAVVWRKWGPYLSERQWGTVREDYSENGDAWNYFTHDQARSRAYRWGEDGMAGVVTPEQALEAGKMIQLAYRDDRGVMTGKKR